MERDRKGSVMTTKLTERQQDILEFIRSTVDTRGIPPTMREIGAKFGIRSTNGVEGHLAALERQGLITREKGKSRGVALPSVGRSTVVIPLLGRVAAGSPVLSPENKEGELSVDSALFSLKNNHDLFALKVRGDSMIEAHIMDGDTLIVHAQPLAQNGDISVVLVDGEATVKRFYAEKNRIRLQPENRGMKPLYVDHGDVQIVGIVVGVIRKV